jgi:Lsr2
MAQRVQIVLEDDLDGGVAAETVTFGLDGVSYEIDLSDKNAGKLRDEFATWIGHARRSGGRRAAGRRSGSGSSNTSSASSRRDLSAVRAWARSNGHQVSDRGRVSAAVQEAYDKAH